MSEKVKIGGLGSKYTKLLREAGVDRIGKLIQYEQSPEELIDRLAATNKRVQVVQRLPTTRTVSEWISTGKAGLRSGKATRNSLLARRRGGHWVELPAASRLPGPPMPPPEPGPKSKE
jgi:hypothetical protein